MSRVVSLIAVLLLLATSAPLVACMTGDAMSQKETTCCRAMHGKCGDMAATGCCRKADGTDEHPQLASTGPTIHVQVLALAWFEMAVAGPPAIAPALLRTPSDHSPPGLVAVQTTVLRI